MWVRPDWMLSVDGNVGCGGGDGSHKENVTIGQGIGPGGIW